MVFLALATMLLRADGVEVSFIPSGATKKAGGYRPMRSEMKTAKPENVKKLPDGLTNPRFGTFQFGQVAIGYVMAGNKIFVDSNHDGDYTNDPILDLKSNKGYISGSATVDIGKSVLATMNFYHFDESDVSRKELKDTVLYYGDFGYEVTLKLGALQSKATVQGEIGPDTTLWVDRNGDGVTSYFHEMVSVGKPFNFTGTTYTLDLKDGHLALEKSKTKVDMEPMPPDLKVGKPVIGFKAETMDGNKIIFPGSFKGKIVLLDFWATWCGPCMSEMPNVIKAYSEYHPKGFEILGVTFDDAKADDKINEVMGKQGMSWKQIYEGKGWDTKIGRQFDVAAIPFSVLVDGSTGKILAVGNELYGEGLKKSLERAFAGR